MSNTGDSFYSWDYPSLFAEQKAELEEFRQSAELSMRAKAITRVNPFFASRPEALMTLASSPYSTIDVVNNSGAMYGIENSARLKGELEMMTPERQRAMFASLTSEIQMQLGAQGYKLPQRKDDRFRDKIFGAVTDVVGIPFKGVGWAADKLQLDEALHFMMWASDKPAHIYRTVRSMDTKAQLAALAGAAVGVGAVIAAPFTGGGSIAGYVGAMSAVGASAYLGAAAGSYATNPSDWSRAWSASKNGERLFEKGAMRKAEEILGDPRLVNAARDLADVLPDGMTLNVLVREAAGMRERGIQNQLTALNEFANKFATPGTPQHQEVVGAIIKLIQFEPFQRAVNVLQDGKISLGRDIADAMQLSPGSNAHKFLSGAVDATAVMTLDPFLVAGKVRRGVEAFRYGIDVTESAAGLSAAFMRIYNRRKPVQRYYDDIAKAVRLNDVAAMQRRAPNSKEMFEALMTHRSDLVRRGLDPEEFAGKHVVEWMSAQGMTTTILRGHGTVRGLAGTDRIILSRSNKLSDLSKFLRTEIKAGFNGAVDVRADDRLVRMLYNRVKETGDITLSRVLFNLFPEQLHPRLRERLLGTHLIQLEDKVRAVSEIIDSAPQRMEAIKRFRATGSKTYASTGLKYTLPGGKVVDLEGVDDIMLFGNDGIDLVNEVRRILDEGIGAGLLPDKPVTRQILRDMALQGSDFTLTNSIGRFIGDIPVIGRTAALIGRTVQRATTMAPRGNWVQIEGEGTFDSIRNFVDLAALGKMPSWLRDDWTNLILHEQTPSLRLALVESFYDNMLHIAGVHLTKDGQQLIDQFLYKVHQAYSPGMIDDVVLADGRVVRRTQFLDHMAEGAALPDLRELRRAMRVGWLARSLGIVDAPIIEQFQTRVWKPAVIMRLGFIPRASGEEMLSFYARGGYGSMAQNFGVRSLARQKRYELLKRLEAEGAPRYAMSKADQLLLQEHGRLPAPIRPLMRAMSHFNFTEPVQEFIVRWSDFYRKALENGLFNVEDKIDRLLTRAAGADMRMAPSAAQRIAITEAKKTMSRGQLNRYAITESVNSILLGNPYSWRRMAAGGVHDDYLRGANKFIEQYETTIARQIGTTTSSPVDPGISRNQITEFVIDERTGRPVEYVHVRGSRELVSNEDSLYTPQYHAYVAQLADDQLTSEHVLPALSRILPPDINVDDLATLTAAFHTMPKGVARTLVSEYISPLFVGQGDQVLATGSLDRVRAILENFQRSKMEDLRTIGTELLRTLDDTDMTLSALLNRWETLTVEVKGVEKVLFEKQFNYLKEFDRLFTPMLEKLTPTQRKWMASYVLNSDFEHAQKLLWVHSTARPDEFFINNGTVFKFAGETTGDLGGAYDDVAALFNSYSEFELFAREQVRAAMYDPYYSRRMGKVAGLNAEEGRLDDFGLRTRRPQVQQAWVPPRFANVTINNGAGPVQVYLEDLTSSDLLQLMSGVDAEATARYAQQASLWLDQVKAGNQVALADRNLADLITSALTHDAPDGYMKAKMLTKPFDDLVASPNAPMTAINFGGSKTPTHFIEPYKGPETAWKLEVAGETYDQRVEEFIEQTLLGVRARVIGGMEESFVPRPRTLDDGTQETSVFLKDANGNLKPVPLDKRVTILHENYYDRFGQPIEFGDSYYFQNRSVVGNDEDVLWEYMAPLLMDVADVKNGTVVFTSRNRMNSNIASRVKTDEAVRLYRSHKNDIDLVKDRLPRFIHATKYLQKKVGLWDRFIRYGFDRVIGPSIDALARRPMAFHFFVQRYRQTYANYTWLMDPVVRKEVDDIVLNQLRHMWVEVPRPGGGFKNVKLPPEEAITNARQVAESGRYVAMIELGNDKNALNWLDSNTLAWLRGHKGDDLGMMLDRVEQRLTRYLDTGRITEAEAKEIAIHVKRLRSRPVGEVTDLIHNGMTGDEYLSYFINLIGPEDVANMTALQIAQKIATDPDLVGSRLTQLSTDNISTLKKAAAARERADQMAADIASTAAINDMLPYIDSHEFKTQFAEIGKPFMPFWYAEENFMKRWARTLNVAGIDVIQRAQLLYMGLRTAGTIRTDNNGRDWFVWPGSSLLHETLGKIPGIPDVPIDVMFQSPTDSILPGFNSRAGTPQFGPFVSVPVSFFTNLFPELEPFELRLLGEIGATRGIIEQIIPTPLQRTYNAIMRDDDTRLMSATMTALTILRSQGRDIEADATAGEIDEFLRDVRNMAKVIVVSQALMGWFSPGPLSMLPVDEGTNIMGLHAEDPSQILNKTFVELVREFGIEEGTIKYLELVPKIELSDIVDPLAFTVSRAESRSGAPLPANELSVKFYDENSNYLDSMPYASPWLLPVDEAAKTPRSMYAYDQQTINGMRKRLTPEEFYNELRFKEGSTQYFNMRTQYLNLLSDARAKNDAESVRRINAMWAIESDSYLKAHPVFADGLLGSSARQRRAKVLEEMRVVVRDPDAPDTPMLGILRQMMFDYDDYLTYKAEYSLDKTVRGRQRTEQLKNSYETYMENFTRNNPMALSFWLSVLRPESALD